MTRLPQEQPAGLGLVGLPRSRFIDWPRLSSVAETPKHGFVDVVVATYPFPASKICRFYATPLTRHFAVTEAHGRYQYIQ